MDGSELASDVIFFYIRVQIWSHSCDIAATSNTWIAITYYCK